MPKRNFYIKASLAFLECFKQLYILCPKIYYLLGLYLAFEIYLKSGISK